MYYLLYPALLVSLAILFIGLKWTIAGLRNKTVGKFQFDENQHTFTIIKSGIYSINIIGAGWSENQGSFFPAVRLEETNKSLELTIPFMSYRSMTGGNKMTEYAQFTAEISGSYTLQCKNTADLSAKESMLMSKRIFQSDIHPSYLGICIKQTLTTRQQFFAIIFTILGVQATGASILGIYLVFIR